MHSWFEVSLRLPNILQLSDEEMCKLFWQLDGRWSNQTKELIVRHKAVGLKLNRNWASVRHWWRCPCCERKKSEIARLSPAKILLACLEVHHDHLNDWVKAAFDERFGRPSQLSPDAFHVETMAKTLSERFSSELICSDCNAADGNAKLNIPLKIDPQFSFSPQEIRAFITPRPNAPHEIDIDKATTIWNGCRNDYESRKLLVSDLIERVAEGQLRRERSGSELSAANMFLRSDRILASAFADATERQPEQHWSQQSSQHFFIRSVQNDGAGYRATKNKPKSTPPPSDAEFEALDTHMAATSKPWRITPPDWRCTCCNRTKREIVRKSKAGQWMGRICHYSEFVVETDHFIIEMRRSIYPLFTQEPVISSEIQHTLCFDCVSIGAQLKVQKPALTDRFYLTVADLQASITDIAPHRNHERDLSIVEDRAISNRLLADAIDAFREHFSLASHARLRLEMAQQRNFSDSEARAYAIDVLEEQRGASQPQLDPFIDWLIEEGKRLDWRD